MKMQINRQSMAKNSVQTEESVQIESPPDTAQGNYRGDKSLEVPLTASNPPLIEVKPSSIFQSQPAVTGLPNTASAAES